MSKLTFIILLVCQFTLFSQSNNNIVKNNYYSDMTNKLNIKFAIDNNIESMVINNEELDLIVLPNLDYRTEIAFVYKFLSFKYGFAPHLFSDYDEEKRGKTKTFNIQTDFYFNKWVQAIKYNKIKGFYVPLNTLNGEVNFILPDIKITKISGATKYRFNKNYSIKAVNTQTELQKKSAGSFIPSFLYSYTKFKVANENSETLSIIDFGINLGYQHTFVINSKIYVSAGLDPGIGYGINKEVAINDDLEKITNKDANFNIKFNGYVSLGYNSKKLFFGSFFKLNSTFRKKNEFDIVDFDNVQSHFQLFLGYRFTAPKFLKKSVDWLEKKSPVKL